MHPSLGVSLAPRCRYSGFSKGRDLISNSVLSPQQWTHVAAAFKPGDHLSTFGGNPVSCAAAIAAIKFHQREKLAAQAREKGAATMAQLQHRLGHDARIGEIRGRGLMIGIECVEPGSKTPNANLAQAIIASCRDQRILLGRGGMYGNVVRIQPPLVITEKQLTTVIDAIAKALAQQD